MTEQSLRQLLQKTVYLADQARTHHPEQFQLTRDWRTACQYAQKAHRLFEKHPHLRDISWSLSEKTMLVKGYPYLAPIHIIQSSPGKKIDEPKDDPLECALEKCRVLANQNQVLVQQLSTKQSQLLTQEQLTQEAKDRQHQLEKELALCQQDSTQKQTQLLFDKEEAQHQYEILCKKVQQEKQDKPHLQTALSEALHQQQYYQKVLTFLTQEVLDAAQMFRLQKYLADNPCEDHY